MIDPDAQAAVLMLLAESRLSEDDIKCRLEQAVDPAYWASVAPFLSVAGSQGGAVREQASLPDKTLDEITCSLASDGYFQIAPLLSGPDVARMRQGIEALRQAGWPSAFAFVFDEFWQITRTPSLVRLLTRVLGSRFRQNADVWCHYVPPMSDSSGWVPHVDGHNKPNRLSLWIPLSDATLDNGCMYVVPRHRLPPSLANPGPDASIGWRDVRAALQSATALPATAGSVLGWHFDVMHWGSRSLRPSHPRISMAVEFVGETVVVADSERPLMAGDGAPPGLRQRLYCVGKGILMYEKFEAPLIRFRELARRLTDPD